MFGESAHGVEAASRLLKKSIRGLFQHAKQKAAAPAPPCARGIRASCTAWPCNIRGLCFIFQTLNVFEKSAGSGFSRQPRRGLAQGGVKQKWRYIPIPRRAGSPSAA